MPMKTCISQQVSVDVDDDGDDDDDEDEYDDGRREANSIAAI